jgi:uncharacterized protein
MSRRDPEEINMKLMITLAVSLCSMTAYAQVSTTRPPFVRAVGQGSVSVQPDMAKIDFSVITTATTAQNAAAQNATQVNALLAALQGLLGSTANIQTISYSLNPNYNYPQNGNPVLTGYTASNTVEVSAGDLSMVGTIIDTGVQAGATTVQSLQFTLKNPDPVLQQALTLATTQAKAHAGAMASGVSMHTGTVRSIQENVSVSVPLNSVAPGATTTPVLPGMVNIQATVTLEVDLTT